MTEPTIEQALQLVENLLTQTPLTLRKHESDMLFKAWDKIKKELLPKQRPKL